MKGAAKARQAAQQPSTAIAPLKRVKLILIESPAKRSTSRAQSPRRSVVVVVMSARSSPASLSSPFRPSERRRAVEVVVVAVVVERARPRRIDRANVTFGVRQLLRILCEGDKLIITVGRLTYCFLINSGEPPAGIKGSMAPTGW